MKKSLREILEGYTFGNSNYNQWRREHAKVFGSLFSDAFAADEAAQIHLTAALIDISQRNFEKAASKLAKLERACAGEFDHAAYDYFTGLNYEMAGDEGKMAEHYGNLFASPLKFEFPLAFHPYYRTAKLAQRDSEAEKAMHVYKKALDYVEALPPSSKRDASAGQIAYDVATVMMYMHRYDDAERYIGLSCRYSAAPNPQRDYVAAILHALRGRMESSRKLAAELPALLRISCRTVTEAIFSGNDPHYCVVAQDRSQYLDFCKWMAESREELRRKIVKGRTADAEESIAEQLTGAFAFMKRKLACRVEIEAGRVIVKCKNYYVRSLMAEHEYLFTRLNRDLGDWKFVSVNEFAGA